MRGRFTVAFHSSSHLHRSLPIIMAICYHRDQCSLRKTGLCKLCRQRPLGLQESCKASATVPLSGARAARPPLPRPPRGALGRASVPAPVRAAATLRSCSRHPALTRRAGGRGGRRGARSRREGLPRGQRAGLGANFCGLAAGAPRRTGEER